MVVGFPLLEVVRKVPLVPTLVLQVRKVVVEHEYPT